MDETMLATQKAEHSLLGAIILEAAGQPESGIIREIAKIVQPEDFLDSAFGEHLHNRIYQAMLFIHGPMNEITVAAAMARRGQLPKGTHAEFPIFNEACPCWMEWEAYALAVRQFSDLRNPNRKRVPELRGGALI